MTDDPRVDQLELVAWVGEDELGSGVIGLKAAMVPAGCIALVATKADIEKVCREQVIEQLQAQATRYGKTIRLCRFVFTEELLILSPREQ